jgi:hypothetical protein
MPDFIESAINTVTEPVFDAVNYVTDNTIGQIPYVGDFLSDMVVPAALTFAFPEAGPYLAGGWAGLKTAEETGDPLAGLLAGGSTYLTSDLFSGVDAGIGSAAGDTPMSIMGSAGPMTTTANAMAGLTSPATAGLSSGGASMFSNIGLKDALGLGSSIFSGINSMSTVDEQEKLLKEALAQASGTLSPYTTAGADATRQLSQALTQGFNPGDLTKDPGYQFQLSQGQDAINKKLAASGMGQSGAAAKAAADYGQGLAGTTYNDAYKRWLEQNQQLGSLSSTGQGAANSLAGLQTAGGNVGAQATGASNEALNKMLSGVMNNSGLQQLLKNALSGAGNFSWA